jgi:protein O-mannosyl-transferase
MSKNKKILNNNSALKIAESYLNTSSTNKKQNYLGLIVFLFATILYSNTINHGYVLDDTAAIIANPNIKMGYDGISEIFASDFWKFSGKNYGYYRPIPLATFALEYEWWGFNAKNSHIINILLYALSGFVLFKLLKKIFKSYSILFPFFISLLFLSHPIHTEVVANIKSRDEILSFLGIITSLNFYLKYVAFKSKTNLVFSLIVFYLSCLCKESSITFLLFLPLILFYFYNNNIKLSIKALLPFIGIYILYAIQKQIILGPIDSSYFVDINIYPYQNQKVLSSILLFGLGVFKTILPVQLKYTYSYNVIPEPHLNSLTMWLSLIVLLTIATIILKQFKSKSISSFGLSLFLISLIPSTIFILLRGGIFAERFLYTSILGYAIFLIINLAQILKINLQVNQNLISFIHTNKMFALIFGLIIGLYFVY